MYYDKSGCMKLIESIEDVYCILKTVSHIDPNYIDKVTDIKLGTTNRGQQKLEFNADNKSVLVIWYPKKKEQLYYCIDNVNQGYANNIFDILDKLFVKSESFNVKLESKNTSYTLKGKINNRDYDIAYDNNFSNLKKLKNELYSCHSHIEMWIEDENRNKKEELAHIHKCEMYNMKELKEAYDIWDNSSKTIETNLKVTDKNEFRNKFYGYRYYIEFDDGNHEYMTNSKSLYDSLEKGKTYLIQYQTTNRLIAQSTASIQIDMKNVKVLRKIEEFKEINTATKGNSITLYHNTSNTNAIKISKEGIKGGMRLSVYGKGSESEGSGVWCSTIRDMDMVVQL